VVSKFHDDFLQLLRSGAVLKLDLQDNLDAFLIKANLVIKFQAFENTWELDELKTGGTVV